MNIPICICCKSRSWKIVPFREKLNYLKCKKCHYYIHQPVEFNNNLGKFSLEQEKFYSDDSVVLSPIFSIIQKEITNRRVRIIKKILPKGSSVLEVGPGNGDVLKQLKKELYKIEAVEQSEELAISLKKVLGIDVIIGEFETQSIPSQKYDAFISSHVIEHVSDVLEHLNKAHDIVKVGGYAFLATPNSEGFENILPFRLSPNYCTSHFQLFSHKALSLCLEQAGWKTISIITPEYTTGWLMVLTKVLKKLKGRENYAKGGENVKYFNNKISIFNFLLNIIRVLSYPLRKIQEKLYRGNELFIIAQRIE